MSSPYLEWVDEKGNVCRLEIVDKVFIGRSCKGIEKTRRIIVQHPRVSRDHAVINVSGSGLEVVDMSKNGTWVNDVRLASGSSCGLADGDVVRLGDTLICVSCPVLSPKARDEGWMSEGTMVTPTEVIVTNVVADVRGFSGMSQAEDSTQVYALIKEIFDTFSTIVHDHKGTVKDYAGDAVYAFWDHSQTPREDVAVLACRAALEQAKTVDKIRSKLSGKNPAAELFRMGWGITTGKVTMSHYGSRVVDMALVGDSINVAFRLSGIANKDLDSAIVICSETAGLVADSLELSDLGFIPVRGRQGEEHVFGIQGT